MNIVQEFKAIGIDLQLREKEAAEIFDQYVAEAVAVETKAKEDALAALATVQADLAKFQQQT